ncbi:unnamed protein product [Rhizophagus irregularis]|nr:unnamed protein product [Rhizophagus irregularis]
MVFYRCTYIHRSGKICNRGCYHPEGYFIHRNSPSQVFCKECGKLSYSAYGYCDDHARKHRKREQYHRKKDGRLSFNRDTGQLGQLGHNIKEQVKSKKEALLPYQNPSQFPS